MDDIAKGYFHPPSNYSTAYTFPCAPHKKKIDNYMIFLEKKLGEGSFGAVYLGEHSATKHVVAVKMLSKKKIDKDDYIKEAIYSQIQILKTLKSINIVGCMDVMESGNFYYIVQEYCNEGELRGLMDRKGMVPEEESLRVLGDICNGFVCMLAEGVIHRDLKPENILIHDGTFKICDFGFSKKLNNRRLKNQTFVGTPLYMSVEILKSEYYTSKCDIWALGIIFYEMLHGCTPWKANSEYQLIKNIESKPLKLSPKLSDNTKDLLSRMLRLQEKDRIDWDSLLRHPVFKGRFNHYVQKSNTLQNKLKYLMSQLRYSIKSQNIDLEKLFSKMGYTRETELNFKTFSEFLKTIDSSLTREEELHIFSKLDTDDSNSISLAELESEMVKHNIPLQSKYKLTKKDSFNVDKQSLQSVTNATEAKIVSAFLKLSGKLHTKSISLQQVFDAYDVNRDGDLTLQEFRRIMKKLDESLSETEVEYAFMLVDFDSSGTITFDEFHLYFCKCVGEPVRNYMTKS